VNKKNMQSPDILSILYDLRTAGRYDEGLALGRSTARVTLFRI
jgi:hypothetical protein